MDLKTLDMVESWNWPEEAGKIILDTLRAKGAEASDRLLAAELAGDTVVINDEIAFVLLATLRSSDEPEALRGAAVISLGPALEQAYEDEFDDPDDELITEPTFNKIQQELRKLYRDARVPQYVRRRILEASVRAPEDWHKDAVRGAYASDDRDWLLTAVFCMSYIGGFDGQVLEALGSKDEEIHYEAVRAAGAHEVDAAWPHIASLITAKNTDKPLLLSAIEALIYIRPAEAGPILVGLTKSKDEDIVETAYEAMAMAEGLAEFEVLDEDDEDLDDE